MRAPTLDELVELPEPLALQRHFDYKNYKLMRVLVVLAGLFSLGGLIGSIDDGQAAGIVIFALNIVLSVTFFAVRRSPFLERSVRQILLVYLLVQTAVFKYATSGIEDEDTIGIFIMAMLVLVFTRLRVAEHFLVYGMLWLGGVLPPAWLGGELTAPAADTVVPLSILAALCLTAAAGWTHLARRRFLADWRRDHFRHRDRLRMREEIEAARRIQVSMLPRGAPDVEWLDIAAVSLPATEVGGDYYEYFPLSPSRLALVIGDVAGHGLASGLLLSGVRSCLYLLEDDLVDPVAVLDRLDRMVRRTTDKRTYMTLSCALFDRETGRLTVASAGHPPVLYYHVRLQTFSELGNGAPPLGTTLGPRYEAVGKAFAPGDILVFYTDGLVEARNAHAQEYGETRLRRVVEKSAKARTPRNAREIREAILGDLAKFKSDERQADDITVVVARVR